MNDGLTNKETFDLVPALYDEIRPDYPLPVLRRIEEYAHLGSGSKILEIGPGTGQASNYFIRQGADFLGVELGANMACFAQGKYADFSNAKFVNSSFEGWHGTAESFDLVLAAQSFHWIETAIGLAKAAAILKPGGAIALLGNSDESQHTEFWKRGTPLHDEYFPSSAPSSGKDMSQANRSNVDAVRNSGLFREVETVEHKWLKTYSADDWIKMRNTFSPDLMLSAAEREEFHRRLRAIIEDLGGSFTRYYRCCCVLGRRK